MSSLMRWEPFEDLLALQRGLGRRRRRASLWPSEFAPLSREMTLDAYETRDEIVFTAVVPGVKPKDIEVTIAHGVLTIKGEIKAEEEVEERDYIRRERRYGKFCRTMTLPKEVNTDKAQAEFEDGILKLTLPKAEAAKAKSIKIKTK